MSKATQLNPEKKKGVLAAIERVGNKFPHPTILFLCLSIITVLLSWILSLCGVSAVHPGTGETVEIFNLVSKERETGSICKAAVFSSGSGGMAKGAALHAPDSG